MNKNLSKSAKTVLEWFLLITCKEHSLCRSTTLFSRNWRPVLNSYFIKNWQKQPTEVFYKKSCSKKFCNIHRKIPVLGSLLNKVACLWTCNSIWKKLQQRCFPVAKFLRKFNLKNASELTLGSDCLELCFWAVAFKTILTQ